MCCHFLPQGIFLTQGSTSYLLHCRQVLSLVAENPPAMQETQVPSLDDPLEKGMATHSGILARRIPRVEEPGGLQRMGLQRVGRD